MVSAAEITKFSDMSAHQTSRIAHRPARVIEIVEPDPKWPASYALISERIKQALGDGLISVEHVGSTSVRGMPAKDTVDVDVVIADPTKEDEYVGLLEAAGFQFLLRSPGWYEHRFFGLQKPHANIHIFGPDCPETIRHRLFRDWLNEHEDDRLKYAQIKREAAAASQGTGETVMEYNLRKEAVVHEIMNRVFRAHGLLPN